jgi:hypothetical protein
MTASGNDHKMGIAAKPIIAYKFPAAFRDGSTPKGPPGLMNN